MKTMTDESNASSHYEVSKEDWTVLGILMAAALMLAGLCGAVILVALDWVTPVGAAMAVAIAFLGLMTMGACASALLYWRRGLRGR